MIMNSNELKVKSEDVLFESICELVEDDQSYFSLFEFVRFEWISTLNMEHFFDVVSSEAITSELNIGILRSLSRRCVLPVSPTGVNDRIFCEGKQIVPESGIPLCGIISYLSKKRGGNVHDQGVVDITASSVNGSYVFKNAADLENRNSFFQSTNMSNSWLCYDFKSMDITPTHYSIQSYPNGSSGNHPRNWCLEVSNDKETWTSIDLRCDCGRLCDGSRIGTYEVSKIETCRYIRLRRTGKNAKGHDPLSLSGLESFGILRER
jgi:hypothetical protein